MKLFLAAIFIFVVVFLISIFSIKQEKEQEAQIFIKKVMVSLKDLDSKALQSFFKEKALFLDRTNFMTLHALMEDLQKAGNFINHTAIIYSYLEGKQNQVFVSSMYFKEAMLTISLEIVKQQDSFYIKNILLKKIIKDKEENKQEEDKKSYKLGDEVCSAWFPCYRLYYK